MRDHRDVSWFRDIKVAILVSGHLRDLCASTSHFAPLEAAVSECRALALCDVSVHTWDTTHPAVLLSAAAAQHIANKSGSESIPLNPPGLSSLPCVGKIQSRRVANRIMVKLGGEAANTVVRIPSFSHANASVAQARLSGLVQLPSHSHAQPPARI